MQLILLFDLEEGSNNHDDNHANRDDQRGSSAWWWSRGGWRWGGWRWGAWRRRGCWWCRDHAGGGRRVRQWAACGGGALGGDGVVDAAVDAVATGVTDGAGLGAVVGVAPAQARGGVRDRRWDAALAAAVRFDDAAIGLAEATADATTAEAGMLAVWVGCSEGVVGNVVQTAHDAVRGGDAGPVALAIVGHVSARREAAGECVHAIQGEGVLAGRAEGIHGATVGLAVRAAELAARRAGVWAVDCEVGAWRGSERGVVRTAGQGVHRRVDAGQLEHHSVEAVLLALRR